MCPAWLRNEKVPKSMISMTKAFNIWLAAWNLPYGPQRKKKNWLRFSTFFRNLSLSLSLFISLFQLSMKKLKPWLLRGVLISLVLLQLIMMTTIAMITLIKTIAQGTYKSTLISLKNSKNLVLLKEKMRFFFYHWENTHTQIFFDRPTCSFNLLYTGFYIFLPPSHIIYICLKWNTLSKMINLESVWNRP